MLNNDTKFVFHFFQTFFNRLKPATYLVLSTRIDLNLDYGLTSSVSDGRHPLIARRFRVSNALKENPARNTFCSSLKFKP